MRVESHLILRGTCSSVGLWLVQQCPYVSLWKKVLHTHRWDLPAREVRTGGWRDVTQPREEGGSMRWEQVRRGGSSAKKARREKSTRKKKCRRERARSELQLSLWVAEAGKRAIESKSCQGEREKEERAGASRTIEKRDNIREKGESTLTSIRDAHGYIFGS